MHVWKQEGRFRMELQERFGLVQKLLEEMVATKGGFHG